jgi:hypothetical protein
MQTSQLVNCIMLVGNTVQNVCMYVLLIVCLFADEGEEQLYLVQRQRPGTQKSDELFLVVTERCVISFVTHCEVMTTSHKLSKILPHANDQSRGLDW